jgi:hypothetical protein
MQEMHDFEQWMRRAGFARQRHQCLEQRAHRAYPFDQSITHDRGTTTRPESAMRLQSDRPNIHALRQFFRALSAFAISIDQIGCDVAG